MDSESPTASMHPLLIAAAEGEFPAWTEAGKSRRGHMARVSKLMAKWARRTDLPEEEQLRWSAAGLLHDTLREATGEVLLPLVPPEMRDLPARMLHGPGAAEMLRREGIGDEELLHAIHNHTFGHEDFGPLGRALFMADYLEPGREYESGRMKALRKAVPKEPDEVLREVAAMRLKRHIDKGRPMLEASRDFWNSIVL